MEEELRDKLFSALIYGIATNIMLVLAKVFKFCSCRIFLSAYRKLWYWCELPKVELRHYRLPPRCRGQPESWYGKIRIENYSVSDIKIKGVFASSFLTVSQARKNIKETLQFIRNHSVIKPDETVEFYWEEPLSKDEVSFSIHEIVEDDTSTPLKGSVIGESLDELSLYSLSKLWVVMRYRRRDWLLELVFEEGEKEKFSEPAFLVLHRW